MTRVQTGCRVHFGLLPPSPMGRHGGCGVMVQEPGVTLTARPDTAWRFLGPLSGVAERAVEHLGRRAGQPHCVEIASVAPAHAGLGTGTQIALAVAAATGPLLTAMPALTDLAQALGRGQRSWVGTLGFAAGGFVVDLGTAEPPRRLPFPADWPIWLAVPDRGSNWSGAKEAAAFARRAGDASAIRSAMLGLLVSDLVPGVEGKDWPRFTTALREYNRLAGRWFADVQGGLFSAPRVAQCVALLEEAGGAAGQSSWGPTVFAVAPSPPRVPWAGLAAEAARLGYRLHATGARNEGFQVSALARPQTPC